MKVRLTFKTPDVVDYAIEDLDPVDDQNLEDLGESEAEAEDLKDDIRRSCEKWVKNGEYLTVEIDTETGTCTPIKVR